MKRYEVRCQDSTGCVHDVETGLTYREAMREARAYMVEPEEGNRFYVVEAGSAPETGTMPLEGEY